ncbi:uncharacterized protein N7498_001965 [Penicillium cinerascens]|uniref:Uncharacterized protein n=1 Tax=Penicillium cinerascens TaxID=70096 RepID=A0A9W9TBH4_9EURO|nr:uncharacterized protein N7498_001932 [Penicillium cinerascens]XP_058311371.1 uncharacterized protein N7498_001965 [Penicillium cinerascens]KAJ5215525.1 hypothetical protein N7498_001932 [Penicillium cinerascens]KAJ5215558.1 hypothetical protein N7498_001965 [Penicillium cinerascens]
MTSSLTFKRKRSPEWSTEAITKRFCDRASPVSSIGGIPEDDISQVLSYEEFQHLDLSAQKEYFDEICKAFHDQECFSKSCPRIDMMILQHYDKDSRLSKEEKEDAYALQEDLKEKWRLS